MLHTYHIHINGQVQGVGFRPFVCKLAEEMNLNGWVINSTDGLHIEFSGTETHANSFYNRLMQQAPSNAVILQHSIREINEQSFTGFSIRKSNAENTTDLLITPDIAMCTQCKEEIHDKTNKRYGYAFTTCLNCGPRYSITRALPYDRETTTMAGLQMCASCIDEYNDINNSRFHSQTNTCKHCKIDMHLFSAADKEILFDNDDEILPFVAEQLKEGITIAVKGIGGYLLLCDAANESAVLRLRERKKRPAKPFAVLYKNLEQARKDVRITNSRRRSSPG
jgi:hydrogenase maturation protein HypF